MTTRKRSNSLIPIEFRNDTSDGGMERAALATVFGVPEYTESKIFWNADEDEDLSSLSSGFRPVQRNASKKSYTSTKSNTMMIQPKQQQETYVSHQRSLPTIPVVSEFGDIWSETNQKEQTKQDEAMIQPPADLSDYPLTIFDLVESDHDQSIILWGTQQQTTVPSNAPSSHEQKKPSHPHAHKLTWSTAQHLLSTSLKLKKKSMSTQQLPIQVSEVSQVIEAATIEKLIEKLTISLDYTFMTDFFLIFRVFMTPVQLCKLLILRTNKKDTYRTFVVMRHWLLNYFLHDFVPSKELRTILTNFLNETPFHPTVKQSPRDQRIIKGLKRVVRRLKKIYYASSSSTRVQVIGPPPPTYEQERVNAMVKEKLAHNSIRQKTLDVVTGVHVDARHSNNTAVRDKHAAQVVVIGNYPSSSSTKTSHTFLDSSRHRRRGSSVSSSVSNNISVDSSAPTNMYNLDDSNNSATKEWNNIKQKGQWGNKSQDFDSSRLSDNSLESLISPGTSDISEYEDEDDEEDAASLSQASFQQNTNHVPTSELTEKLEKIRHEQDLNKQFPPKAFYNAQLAIPSTTSTPDVYYPTSHYFNSKPEVNTSFVRSNSDPTGSEIMHTNQQETNLQLLQQKPMRNKPVDPRTKPLPPLALSSSQESDIGESTLLSSSIISHAKTKQLPRGPSNETWKISAPPFRI
ncbi:uncharacterized protein B0P05DRAFT_592687 [Gilbertella persicaria]|uniref:uncharacterized protein n=1 Tax=Gilbertella persicaria TaxID=101096 RepID=UPI00222081E5|nr:uncharacterized protein B0P05DRAFT_592687 [Gilbertella persicaria]KAI8047345.1 hypothetical protein B0P05DRAFT_592687 [Gilbertella persicaria]